MVALLAVVPLALVVPAKAPYNNMTEFMAALRKDKLTFASAGKGEAEEGQYSTLAFLVVCGSVGGELDAGLPTVQNAVHFLHRDIIWRLRREWISFIDRFFANFVQLCAAQVYWRCPLRYLANKIAI